MPKPKKHSRSPPRKLEDVKREDDIKANGFKEIKEMLINRINLVTEKSK